MTLVVGYVPTDEGRDALKLAADEAVRRGAHLLVVSSRHVDYPASARDLAAYEVELKEVRHELEDEFENDFKDLRQRLGDAGVVHEFRAMVPSHDPSADLITAAAEANADFVVIGLRRRTAVGKLLLGSNAQRILTDAPCPVIAVHATGHHGL